jgi:hypothetical protein
MGKGTSPPRPPKQGKHRGRGKVTPRVKVEEEVIPVEIPPESVFKGDVSFLVQDLVISAKATCYPRERWVTPDGRTILAPLPQGIGGHFSPELHRFAGAWVRAKMCPSRSLPTKGQDFPPVVRYTPVTR